MGWWIRKREFGSANLLPGAPAAIRTAVMEAAWQMQIVATYVWLDVLHRVVDRETRGDLPARGVDVEGDVLFRVLGLEEEHLSDDQIGDRVVDRLPQENDVVFEKARIDVVRALSPALLLDDHRDEAHTVSLGIVFLEHHG